MSIRHILCAAVLVAGCHHNSEPPPPKPSTGSPVAMIGSDVKPGADHKGSIAVKAYNFSDKRVAQYTIVFRFHDASGALLKVKAGTPFEAESDFTSLSGEEFLCEPTSWCGYTLDHMDVPDKVATVEILASRVGALKDDGAHFEDKPLFKMAHEFEWPK